jgi:hypothetical protein
MDEDLLDWQENKHRSRSDLRRTDFAFVGMAVLLTGLLIAAIAIGMHWLHRQ